MYPIVQKDRLRVAGGLTCLLLLTTACGLKASAVNNLTTASAANGGAAAGTGTGATGSTGAAGSGGAANAAGGTTTAGSPGAGTGTGTAAGPAGTSAAGSGGTGTAAGGTGTAAGGPKAASGTPCGVPTGGDTTGITKSVINIGLHAPLTGTGTPFPNSSFQKGAQVFFDQPGHTVCGRKVQVDFEDDKYTPDGANQVCSQFAKSAFLAIGGAGTDQIQACATNSDVQQRQMPYLSAGVTDNGLTALKNYFAVSLTYKQQGSLVVRNAIAQGFGKPAPSSGGAKKQWEIVTGKSGNFDSATEGITQALTAAGISYHVTRFDQNSGNYDNAATQLGQTLALNGVKTIFVDAAPGAYVFIVKGYYNAAPTGNGVHWTGPGVTFTDFLVAQLTCQVSANAISGAADFLAPAPGIDRATDDFKKAFNGSYDDIEWGLWGLDSAVYSMLQKANTNLTRQNFISTVQSGAFSTPGMAPSVFNGGHFGGTGAWVQRVDCSKNDPDQPSGAQGNGFWTTIGSTYLKP